MGSDFQRTILWVILAASVFMLWDNWQVYNGKPSFFGTPTAQTAVVTRAELLKEYKEADWTEVGLAGMILGKTAPKRENIVLFDVTPKHVYVAQSGLIGGDFPNHKSAYKYIGTETSNAMDTTALRSAIRSLITEPRRCSRAFTIS